MPYPRPKETKSQFISRAIEQFVSVEKFSLNEAKGRAFGFWKTYHKESKNKK